MKTSRDGRQPDGSWILDDFGPLPESLRRAEMVDRPRGQHGWEGCCAAGYSIHEASTREIAKAFRRNARAKQAEASAAGRRKR